MSWWSPGQGGLQPLGLGAMRCPAPAAGVEMVRVLLVCASAASPLAAQPHISIKDAPLCATEAGAAFATSSCRQ